MRKVSPLYLMRPSQSRAKDREKGVLLGVQVIRKCSTLNCTCWDQAKACEKEVGFQGNQVMSKSVLTPLLYLLYWWKGITFHTKTGSGFSLFVVLMIQICDTALFCMYRSVTPTLELALCKQRPAHYLFGKLNATEFVQKLAAQGIVDAKVGLGETGKLIANLCCCLSIRYIPIHEMPLPSLLCLK